MIDPAGTEVYHTGTVKYGQCPGLPVERVAMHQYTVTKNGAGSSLSVDPSADLDPDGHLKHRLLYEGCGYQARPVPCDEANTYYVVYWPKGGGVPPRVYLYLRTPITRLSEITRPHLLMASSTRHHQVPPLFSGSESDSDSGSDSA